MGIKACRKKRKTLTFIVNKRPKEAEVKFLIEHDKKEFKLYIITLYIEETPDMNFYNIPNELKQILVHKGRTIIFLSGAGGYLFCKKNCSQAVVG